MGSHESYMESPLLDSHYRVDNHDKRKTWGKYVFFFLALLIIIALATIIIIIWGSEKYPVKSEIGVVAADDVRCSKVGVSMLRQGGNAVDAAVATTLCIGVVDSILSGIGGGAFMVLRSASTSEAFAFDMRETAPAAASKDMYKNDTKAKSEGPLSIAVPGEIAGLHEAWKKYGSLPWQTLFQPAIQLAKHGFEVYPHLATYIVITEKYIMADPGLRQVYAPNGKILKEGDICYNKWIAESLETIAEQGPKAFYHGRIGRKLVKDVRNAGGILTMDDLRNYKVRVTDPLSIDIMGYKVLGMPPPSGGTVGLSMIVNVLQNYGGTEGLKGPLGLHRLIEAAKHMFGIRMNLGDPAFVDVSKYISLMTSKSFAKKIWHKIYDDKTFPPEYYLSRWSQIRDNGTAHICIVDSERNAVAITMSVNDIFGSKMLSPSTGIVLNNQMNDFSTPTDQVLPGELPPAPANFIEPGKRPMSSMTPLIILKDGQLAGVTGGTGGLSITPAVTQVFLNHFVLGMDPAAAVLSPRVFPRLMVSDVTYENVTLYDRKHIQLPKEAIVLLKNIGHNLTVTEIPLPTCNLVVQKLGDSIDLGRKYGLKSVGNVKYGTLTAVSDPRNGGHAAAV